LRIIGGEWRSRRISFAAVDGLRPTPDRVRETLFNWLQFDITGARCLDVFAGSGILGIEAVSRGAASALLIESNLQACTAITMAIGTLKTERVQLLRGDAITILATAPKDAYDIVFVDPPFRMGLVSAAIERLELFGWVVPGSKIYIEKERDSTFLDLPSTWRVVKRQNAGEVAYYLCERDRGHAGNRNLPGNI
jgi:16S rRNA (guanine966-N2)-methyltransferase